jgi:hypothetical protein
MNYVLRKIVETAGCKICAMLCTFITRSAAGAFEAVKSCRQSGLNRRNLLHRILHRRLDHCHRSLPLPPGILLSRSPLSLGGHNRRPPGLPCVGPGYTTSLLFQVRDG